MRRRDESLRMKEWTAARGGPNDQRSPDHGGAGSKTCVLTTPSLTWSMKNGQSLNTLLIKAAREMKERVYHWIQPPGLPPPLHVCVILRRCGSHYNRNSTIVDPVSNDSMKYLGTWILKMEWMPNAKMTWSMKYVAQLAICTPRSSLRFAEANPSP